VSGDFIRATRNLWLHDLHIEVADDVQANLSSPVTLVEVAGSDVWITGCSLVGDDKASRGVDILQKGRIYARGVLS
jgi:hypothetical protein